jgi:hypothetical protein
VGVGRLGASLSKVSWTDQFLVSSDEELFVKFLSCEYSATDCRNSAVLMNLLCSGYEGVDCGRCQQVKEIVPVLKVWRPVSRGQVQPCCRRGLGRGCQGLG